MQAAAAAQAQAEAQRAAVEQAQLNLDFTTITAPVDGIAGLARVQVGDLVGASTGPHHRLEGGSDQGLLHCQRAALLRIFESLCRSGGARRSMRKQLRFELILADGSSLSARRRTFRGRQPGRCPHRLASGRGLFPNPGNILRPGQFARIRVRTEVRHRTPCSSRNAPSPNCRAPTRWRWSDRITRRTCRR